MSSVTMNDVLEYKGIIFRFIMKLTRGDKPRSEDVLQEVLIRAHENLHTIRDKSKLKSWLHTVAFNTSANQVRSEKKFVFLTEEREFLTFVDPVCFVDQIINGDSSSKISDYVHEIVSKLPPRQKQALILRLEGLSFKEMAVIMDCPYDTAKANYRIGMLKIKKMMEGDYYDSCIEEFVSRA